MNYFECKSSAELLQACQQFKTNLIKSKNEKAIRDAESMFNTIRDAANFYDIKIRAASRGRVWVMQNDINEVIGLMLLRDEGDRMHLLNLVGIPGARGGAALLKLAKEISTQKGKPLKLEAADAKLRPYYQNQFFVSVQGGATMEWTRDGIMVLKARGG